MAETELPMETVVAETKTEKVVEVQTTGSFLEHLDDSEREFIAKGIHNFAYRKEECYDEQGTQDLRRELKAALRAIGSDGLIPEHIIDAKIDTAVLPLGQKKGYWLKRLISKTGGETQKLLRGLEKVNMFLRNYGQARRRPPVPPKKITVPVEKFLELEEKASSLDIKSNAAVEIAPVPESEPATMETVPDKPNHIFTQKRDKKQKDTPESKREYDADSESDSEDHGTRHRSKRYKGKQRRSRRVKFYEPSSSESSEESDDSEDDFKYYYKRLKKPHKVYSYKKPSKATRPFSSVPFIKPEYKRLPDQLFNTNVPIKSMSTDSNIEVSRPIQQQQQQQLPLQPQYNFQNSFGAQKPSANNDYINHFLGNTRR